MARAKSIDVNFIKWRCWLLGRPIRFIIVFVAFFVLLLSVIRVTVFISGTTTDVFCLNELHPLKDIFCFIRSVIMSAKTSLVISEAVAVVMKSNIESTSGRLWLLPFKWSIASNIFGLKMETLILAFKSEWITYIYHLYPFLMMHSLSK